MKNGKPQNVTARLPSLSPVIQDGLPVAAKQLGAFFGLLLTIEKRNNPKLYENHQNRTHPH